MSNCIRGLPGRTVFMRVSNKKNLWCDSPKRAKTASFVRFLDHTKWHVTVGRNPLHEGSASRRDLYLSNTKHSQETDIRATAGTGTHNSSKRSAVDPRLRPLGHWDCHNKINKIAKLLRVRFVFSENGLKTVIPQFQLLKASVQWECYL
jgi:hypothetical protein